MGGNFLPVGKLFLYFLQSVVRPVSRGLLTATKQHPRFVVACERVAEKHYKLYKSISEWTGNRSPFAERLFTKRTQKSQQEAVEFCTDLLGELMILGAGAGFIVYEYRKGKKNKKKNRAIELEQTRRIDELEMQVKRLESQPCLVDCKI